MQYEYERVFPSGSKVKVINLDKQKYLEDLVVFAELSRSLVDPANRKVGKYTVKHEYDDGVVIVKPLNSLFDKKTYCFHTSELELIEGYASLGDWLRI